MRDTTELRTKRRARLVATAQEVFIAQGFRGATMEGIADAASISKATLYSYFPDKPAIFDAVAENVARDLTEIVAAELKGTDDPVDAVIAAVTAKHMFTYSLVRTSNFAQELFQTKDAVSAHHFERMNSSICESLARRLSEVRHDSQECAELLMAASQGIANAARSKDQLRGRIAKLRLLLDT
ncbi:TetR/AcrR family transcriptional regulator [Yoonia sp. SS1-5]|uniref:TetR/AcrR family transcriptional regulator n=1 Tax=Yoonia rhodophyticola TaxID=3137370 RepID=A0AAN0M9M3_9RHOB